jgi:hypothetical protein
MKLVTKEILKDLAQHKNDLCISIYSPTHRAGKDVLTGKDVIAFKTEVQKIKNQLEDRGMHVREVTQLLQPAYDLMEDTNFWRKLDQGLVVFIGKNFFQYHIVPISFEPFSLISHSFHLEQLLPLVSENGKYFILALDLENVKLYQATKYAIKEMNLGKDVPNGLEKYLESIGADFEESIQHHAGNGSPNTAIFHGQGEGIHRDSRKPYIKEFFFRLQDGVFNKLKDGNAPLVIFGDEYLHHYYKEANKYHNLFDKGVFHNYNEDQVSVNDLHQKTWDLVEPYFLQKKEEAILKYNKLAGTGKTSKVLEEIIPEAKNGRVETLFVAKGTHYWGHVKEEEAQPIKVEKHESFEQDDECLISISAIETIINGGEAYLVEKDEFPETATPADIVAVFRY